MARQPRLDPPGMPQHVVQRGNDRQPCFFNESDYARYLAELNEACRKEGCTVHAYVLMTNHVHLLVTPMQSGCVGRMMQSLGRRYVRYVNDHYRRTGTLWEGRFKSSLVDTEGYLLQCHRYIELNPVRAGMVGDPGHYAWSSHAHNAFGRHNPLLDPHPVYLALGPTHADRCVAYRDWVMQPIEASETKTIRLTLQSQHALGSERFRQAIEKQLARRAGPAKIGRPRKELANG